MPKCHVSSAALTITGVTLGGTAVSNGGSVSLPQKPAGGYDLVVTYTSRVTCLPGGDQGCTICNFGTMEYPKSDGTTGTSTQILDANSAACGDFSTITTKMTSTIGTGGVYTFAGFSTENFYLDDCNNTIGYSKLATADDWTIRVYMEAPTN